jgi:hypothetical protein
MKTLDLSTQPISVAELLDMAEKDSLLVKRGKGDSFVISHADEFATEVELLRRNHAFLAMLDKLKQDQDTVPLKQVRKQLR